MSVRRCVPEVSSESQIERFKRKILHFFKLLLLVTGNGFLYGLQFSSFMYLGCK